ncbi:hypothetical protein [Enterobacter cloacae]|jgi:hypothetical protein|uniref:hypothetical protein n=1 Tax=Enterobacter cloacae TaxID=550 RepID=UPI0039C65DA8
MATEMTLIQAQQQYINTMKTIAGTINKRVAVGARLRLAKWCKQHGYEVVPVLHDAIDMLDLELEAK